MPTLLAKLSSSRQDLVNTHGDECHGKTIGLNVIRARLGSSMRDPHLL